jgi:hypothetical protein
MHFFDMKKNLVMGLKLNYKFSFINPFTEVNGNKISTIQGFLPSASAVGFYKIMLKPALATFVN